MTMEFARVQLILKNNGNCLFCQSPAPGLNHSLTPLLHSLQVNNVKDEGQHVEVDLNCFEIKTGLCNECGNLSQRFIDLKQMMISCLETIKAKMKVGSEKNDGGMKYPSLEHVIMKETLDRLNKEEPQVVLQDLPLSERSNAFGGIFDEVGEDVEGKAEDSNAAQICYDPCILEEAPPTSRAKNNCLLDCTARTRKSKPRGRLNAYGCFRQTRQEEHKKQYPNKEMGCEFYRECADHWRAMNDEEKAHFFQMAASDSKRYKQERETYLPRKRRGNKLKKKDPNAPKRHLCPFFWFCYDERAKVKKANPWYSVTDLSRELGVMWKEVDPETRRKYETMSIRDKARYEKEMTEYKASRNPAPNGNDEKEDEEVGEVEKEA